MPSSNSDFNDNFGVDATFVVPPSPIFPPAEIAGDDGLLAVGGPLTPNVVLDALAHGVFPWSFASDLTEAGESGNDEEEEDAANDSEWGECETLEEYDGCEGDKVDSDDEGDEDDGEINDDGNIDGNVDVADNADNNDSIGTNLTERLLASLSARSRNAVWNGFKGAELPTLADAGEYLGWWSPNPRAVLELDGFHCSRRLARTIRSGKFRTTFDKAFPEVAVACATAKERRDEGSWISREFFATYTRLFELGFAHSAECWLGDRLVGGVYGVALNGFFDGESMFSVERDASKVALAALVERLKTNGFQLFDLQILNPHTASLGGTEIPRAEYLRRLNRALAKPARF